MANSSSSSSQRLCRIGDSARPSTAPRECTRAGSIPAQAPQPHPQSSAKIAKSSRRRRGHHPSHLKTQCLLADVHQHQVQTTLDKISRPHRRAPCRALCSTKVAPPLLLAGHRPGHRNHHPCTGSRECAIGPCAGASVPHLPWASRSQTAVASATTSTACAGRSRRRRTPTPCPTHETCAPATQPSDPARTTRIHGP